MHADRQTDRRTDRILIARPCLHPMQRGKNVLEVCLQAAVCYTRSETVAESKL